MEPNKIVKNEGLNALIELIRGKNYTKTEVNSLLAAIRSTYYTKGEADSKYEELEGSIETAQTTASDALTAANSATSAAAAAKSTAEAAQTTANSKLSSSDLKTINGNSLIGTGNIEIKGGGSDVPYIVGGGSSNLLSFSFDDDPSQINGAAKLSYAVHSDEKDEQKSVDIPTSYFFAIDDEFNRGGLLTKLDSQHLAIAYSSAPTRCTVTAKRPSWGKTNTYNTQYYFYDLGTGNIAENNYYPYDPSGKMNNTFIGNEAYILFDEDSTPGLGIAIECSYYNTTYTNYIYVPDSNGELQPLKNVKKDRFYHIITTWVPKTGNLGIVQNEPIYICDNAVAVEEKEWELLYSEALETSVGSVVGAATNLPINLTTSIYSGYKRYRIKFHGVDSSKAHPLAPYAYAYYDSSGWFDLVYFNFNGVGTTTYNSNTTTATTAGCFWNNSQDPLRFPSNTGTATTLGTSDGEVTFLLNDDNSVTVSGWMSHTLTNKGTAVSPAAYSYNYTIGSAQSNMAATAKAQTLGISGSFDTGSYYTVLGSKKY